MKKHKWTVETIDGGHLGEGDFWICENCGASGGFVFSGNEPRHPFYADGSGLRLTNDCDESKILIEQHKEKKVVK